MLQWRNGLCFCWIQHWYRHPNTFSVPFSSSMLYSPELHMYRQSVLAGKGLISAKHHMTSVHFGLPWHKTGTKTDSDESQMYKLLYAVCKVAAAALPQIAFSLCFIDPVFPQVSGGYWAFLSLNSVLWDLVPESQEPACSTREQLWPSFLGDEGYRVLGFLPRKHTHWFMNSFHCNRQNTPLLNADSHGPNLMDATSH